MTRRRLYLAGLWVALLALPQWADACPGCNAMIAERTSSFSAPLAVGLYWSILFLLTVPVLLVGMTTWLLIRAARRHAAARAMRQSNHMEAAAHGA